MEICKFKSLFIQIRDLIKIHKIDSSLRPIVNCKDAPAYTLARVLARNLEMFIPLPNTFNVKNSIQPMNDHRDIPFDKDLKFVSFDIKNMYYNIPITELIKIIDIMCKQKISA
jgi:hypothetical protein